MKRLVIVEDQTAIREMLAEILRLDANYKLVGESGDGQSALTLCLDVQPDVLVLDAKLPGLNGVLLDDQSDPVPREQLRLPPRARDHEQGHALIEAHGSPLFRRRRTGVDDDTLCDLNHGRLLAAADVSP